MIISIMCILLLFFLLLFTKARFGTVLKMNTLFNVMWLMGIVVIQFGMGGIEPISESLCVAIITSVIVFNVLYLFLSVPTLHASDVIIKETLSYNIKRLYVLNLLCYIYMLPITIKAIGIIATLGFPTLRNYAFDTSLGLVTDSSSRICSWFIYPIFIVTMLISCFYIVNRKKDKIIIFAIFDLLLYIVTFGGRSLIIRYLLYIVFAALLCSKSILGAIRRLSRKMKIICAIAFIVCLYLISLRMWGGLSILDNIIIYVWGSVKYCDILMSTTSLGGTLNGAGIFGVFYNPLAYILNMFLGSNLGLSETIIQDVSDIFVSIGESNFNALPSMLYVFWCDYKWIGILIGTLFFCTICVWIERRYRKTPSLANGVLMVFIIYSVFQSTSDYPIYKISHFLTIAAIFFITKFCCVKVRRK